MQAKKKAGPRSAQSYLAAAKSLSRFAPSLKKYKRRKTLKPHEKAAIARKEKLIGFYGQHLVPVSKKQARALKKSKSLWTPPGAKSTQGIQAIELRNTASNAKLHVVDKEMFVTSNGRVWVYWALDRATVKTRKGMADAAEKAFDAQFPLDKVAALADVAFKELKPRAVYLWTKSGRAGLGFDDFKAFLHWLHQEYGTGRYSSPEEWVKGIAILVKEG